MVNIVLKQEKNQLIDELSKIFLSKKIVLFVKYSHLSVHYIDNLRSALRECDATFKVIKNKLSKIAFQRNNLNYDEDFFIGPNSIVFSDNPIEMVKVLFKFSKANNQLKISSALLDKDVLNYDELVQLSKIPSLEVIRSKILQSLLFPGKSVLQNLNFFSSKLVYLLSNFSSKKKG